MNNQSENDISYYQRRKSGRVILVTLWKYTLIVLTCIFCAFLFTTKNPETTNSKISTIQPGSKWNNPDLKAAYTFQIPRSDFDILTDKESIENNPLFIYLYIPNAMDSADKILSSILKRIPMGKSTEKYYKIYGFDDYIVSPILNLSPQERATFLNNVKNYTSNLIEVIYSNGLINNKLIDIKQSTILADKGLNNFQYYKKSELIDKKTYEAEFDKYVKNKFNSKYYSFLNIISDKIFFPNLEFDAEQTNEHMELSILNIPKTKELIRKGQIIISKDQIIDDAKHRVLSYYFSASNSQNIAKSSYIKILGNSGHAIILVLLVFLYIIFLRKDIWKSTYQYTLILFSVSATVLMAWVTMRLNTDFPLEYLIFLPAFIILISITIDARSAIIVALISSLLIAGIRNNDYILGTIYLIGSGATAYTIRHVQIRMQMFQSIFVILLGFTIPILIFGIEINADYEYLFRRIATSGINSIVSPAIAILLLFLMDKLRILNRFNTDIDIRHYDNKNHPLLQMLNEKAPGTYKHTMGVADIAERCAQEIGANIRLTRVGAYFHDIGKMLKAEYFTENQQELQNKHNKLTPKQSGAIIRNHVADGIELAEHYKLPEKIRLFIPTHHGTSLIKHFYAKALEDFDSVDINNYRYKGPKPLLKEHAILMICDSAEAISRVSDLTLEQIEKIINDNIKEKLLDGQFDECDITFKELTKIRQVIAKYIIGATHKRTAYMEIPKGKTP